MSRYLAVPRSSQLMKFSAYEESLCELNRKVSKNTLQAEDINLFFTFVRILNTLITMIERSNMHIITKIMDDSKQTQDER